MVKENLGVCFRISCDVHTLELVSWNVQVLQDVVSRQKRKVGHFIFTQVQTSKFIKIVWSWALEELHAVLAEIERFQIAEIEVCDAGDWVLGQVEFGQTVQGVESSVFDFQDDVVVEADAGQGRGSAEGVLGYFGDAVAIQRQFLQGWRVGQEVVGHSREQAIAWKIKRLYSGERPDVGFGEGKNIELIPGEIQDFEISHVFEEPRLDEVDLVTVKVQVTEAGVVRQSLLGEVLHLVTGEVQHLNATRKVDGGTSKA